MEPDVKLPAALAANAVRAPVILIGSVLSVGAPPDSWSGRVPAYQEVTYRPVRWLWVLPPLAPNGERLVIRHLVVAKSRTADPEHPRLRTDLFKEGAEMLLFVDLVDGQWTCIGENYGAVPLTPEVRDLIGKALGRKAGG
jgi:hypothetical protein